MKEFASIDVRPYQLVNIVSMIGGGCDDKTANSRLDEILKAVRENPAIPLTLRCNLESVYEYQNPGFEQDTPEGKLFNIRRDLLICQRLGLVPGDTRTAIDLFKRLLANIETLKDISWFEKITSEDWRGQEKDNCHYKAGRAKGLEAIIPPRSAEEMQRVKEESVKLIYEADVLRIRPHHLMCMTCFYGEKEFVPIDEDNLFEPIDIIHKNPDILIELICGTCMICPPCPDYYPPSKKCIGGIGMPLRDELKDLNVLQRIGLKYSDQLPARELYQLLFDRISTSKEICGFGDDTVRSPEWSFCEGAQPNPNYTKGRAAGIGFLEPRTD